MSKFMITEADFRALVRGQPLRAGAEDIILVPTIGWVAQLQALVEAIKAGEPPKEPRTLQLVPAEPPEAREMTSSRRRG
jgi:hypothetical protein